MKRLCLICSLILSLGFSIGLSAQTKIIPRERIEALANPSLSPDSASLDFDTRLIVAERMNEDDSPKVFTFGFRNVGDSVIDIKRLVSTCSCAAATCSRQQVKPGESAQINVRYNPKGHPGRFERKVFVYTDDSNEPAAVLRLMVEVGYSAEGTTVYPVEMGSVRLRRKTVTFPEGVKAVERIPFMNVGSKNLALKSNRMLLPSCLEVRVQPEVVGPGSEGEIVISFDPSKGKVKERMSVVLDGLGLPPSQSSINVEIKNR